MMKLRCQDHTVTKEYFDLILDKELEMLVTSPKPKDTDLAKYYESDAYISHTDSKKSILDKVYQWVRNYTIKQKVKLINSFEQTDKSILDIGTGTGDFLWACKNDGWQVTGVEPNEKARAAAISKLANTNNEICDSLEEISTSLPHSKPLLFDVITLWHVLEHVPNLTDYISNIKRLLKPNGTLLIAVPNYKSFDATHYKEFWAAYDVPRHLWHFSKQSIKKLFEVENMKVVKVLPMKFDSYYVSLLSEKYKSGNSNFIKACYIGFQSNRKAAKTKEYSSHIYVIKNS